MTKHGRLLASFPASHIRVLSHCVDRTLLPFGGSGFANHQLRWLLDRIVNCFNRLLFYHAAILSIVVFATWRDYFAYAFIINDNTVTGKVV